MNTAIRNLIMIFSVVGLSNGPVTAAADEVRLEERLRTEQLQELEVNARRSLVPEYEPIRSRTNEPRNRHDVQSSDNGYNGVIDILPFPRKRVSFSPR